MSLSMIIRARERNGIVRKPKTLYTLSNTTKIKRVYVRIVDSCVIYSNFIDRKIPLRERKGRCKESRFTH